MKDARFPVNVPTDIALEVRSAASIFVWWKCVRMRPEKIFARFTEEIKPAEEFSLVSPQGACAKSTRTHRTCSFAPLQYESGSNFKRHVLVESSCGA